MIKHLALLVHRIFPIFLFIGLAWGQNPCDNKEYTSLLKKGYDNLNDDEFDLYIDLHEKCKQHEKSKTQERKTNSKEFIVGKWRDSDPQFGGVYTIKIVNGKNILEITYDDGSSSREYVGIAYLKNKKKITLNNGHNEYIFIRDDDNILRYYDSYGPVKSMKPIK